MNIELDLSSSKHIKKNLSVGLLASEMASRGGIQSFMLRVTEVMGAWSGDPAFGHLSCFSLNDTSAELRQHPALPTSVEVWGAGRQKLKFIVHALQFKPTINALFVGHIHLSPLAAVLKIFGKIDSYYIILHGIEAWHRVSFLQRCGLLRAKKIIATTHFTAEECAKHNGIPLDCFQVIPLCADERYVKPAPEFKLNGAFKLLCVARQDACERYKGFEQLFQALALLKPSHPDIHLNLVGQGNDQPRLQTVVADLGISEMVTFWGGLSDEELAAAYVECDVFAMPSKKEGFGIVFLEAMRLAKPCIGGNHGGTPDVIEDGKSGFLVDYEDLNALVESIRQLADNRRLCSKMGEYGQQLVKSKFSLQAFQSAYKLIALES